ncbi:MAG TPA: hypothetical protein VN613_07650 [Gemmatimonadaceae bacterium]|nr:hypothetical protein [Gemmatimonadaceae bacterium]
MTSRATVTGTLLTVHRGGVVSPVMRRAIEQRRRLRNRRVIAPRAVLTDDARAVLAHALSRRSHR